MGADSSDLGAAIDVTVESLEEGLELLARMGIDIRPGSDDNPINVTSRGLIPVAILGSATLDVFDLDVTTLSFGRVRRLQLTISAIQASSRAIWTT